MKNDSLGDRMKAYENINRGYLMKKTPVILRNDGRAFHNFTKKYCNKAFDQKFKDAMHTTALNLMKNISGAKMAYIQSDEISIYLSDMNSIQTQPWFSYNIQKMTSISASLTTQFFIKAFFNDISDVAQLPVVCFDSRVFNIPEDDLPNYFIWRQRDWNRNSLQMYSRMFFSHKELNKKNSSDMHEMLHSIGKNWANDLSDGWKNGEFIVKLSNGFTRYYDDNITYESFGKMIY